MNAPGYFMLCCKAVVQATRASPYSKALRLTHNALPAIHVGRGGAGPFGLIYVCKQGFAYATGKDDADGLGRAHSELVIRELAKFHAITFCLKMGDNDSMLER